MPAFAVAANIANRLNGNVGYWTALRAAVKNSLYPGGVPTAPMDSVANVEVAALSTTLRRYTKINPGGRTGGTVQYADVWEPDAGPDGVDKCLVFLGGHHQTYPWWTIYTPTDGSSVMRRMHDLGWLIVHVPMPAYDVNPNPQLVMIGGSVLSIDANHPYYNGFIDGGPNPNRLFTDVPVHIVNSIIADYGITRFALAGHSGGGAITPFVASVDDRYRVVRSMQGGTFGIYVSQTDAELWFGNPIFATVAGGDSVRTTVVKDGHPSILAASAAVAGRVTVADYGIHDEYFGEEVYPGSTAAWQALTEQMDIWLRPMDARFQLYLKTDLGPDRQYHTTSVSQAAATEAHLVSNMP